VSTTLTSQPAAFAASVAPAITATLSASLAIRATMPRSSLRRLRPWRSAPLKPRGTRIVQLPKRVSCLILPYLMFCCRARERGLREGAQTRRIGIEEVQGASHDE
jgi:hypothetical protein